ncbi:carbamoyl-phosphate synthase (glutamine-hydrolyzing) large subunit [Ornithinibacillus scapharcae]|uniref:carbamoyl-phosphate synthase (glutamine-hydrolyzing) large subunit n=1 Tax=Ornithinibacillus scapharcae TaxID=1147159 RepID=UPI000225AE89|nr:carbamoyl-phosphate synthase (glutamine-hydrolyzing) large subunit [Ornithinibacillus scapharcae]
MYSHKKLSKVLIIGSGPITIGQAAEFDYSGTQACLALQEEGIEVVLLNNNPATIMTDPSIASKVYMEPLVTETVEEILIREKPDGILASFGGQTALNLLIELSEKGILEQYQVEILGSSLWTIQQAENREKFRSLMQKIGEPVIESKIVTSLEEGIEIGEYLGFPLMIRPAYTLGGEGGGHANNITELKDILTKGLLYSPINQVIIERSLEGWKEIEYEIIRDSNDTSITVCNMENVDPIGIHTGDSIVVAPSQTLNDKQYQMLRSVSLRVIRALEVIGACNIQFALHPQTNDYYIIEVNPRVSRSSALASKATGYPIARIAAKCAIGLHLHKIRNPITGSTFSSSEPALDYVVVKMPRFPFEKFRQVDRGLGTQMKATGEVMAIDRSFEGALNKAIRSLDIQSKGLYWHEYEDCLVSELIEDIKKGTDTRIFAIAEALRRGVELATIHKQSHIDIWFLEKIENIVRMEQFLSNIEWNQLPYNLLHKAKELNFSDVELARIFGVPEKIIRERRYQLGIIPNYKQVDTCAAEFEALTPYYYSTWRGSDDYVADGIRNEKVKVLVLGSGPIRIGQGIEFDYCSVHAALALKEKGYESIVINNNPETLSTDYATADRLYFEPLTVEDILHVIDREKISHVLVQFGGQTAINLVRELVNAGVQVLGTSLENIHLLEDRDCFYHLLDELNIEHPKGREISSFSEIDKALGEIETPIIVRPSYVIGGESMQLIYHRNELVEYLEQLSRSKKADIWPLVIDQYMEALECEVDVISDGTNVLIAGIFEHVERTGVHSGDSIAITPSISLSQAQKEQIQDITKRICSALPIIGMMNIQFLVKEDDIFIIEVNPRASRTVPILSKVTGIPLIKWATYIQLGETLDSLTPLTGLLDELPFFAIKLPVFSTHKLPGIDPSLGPIMKSTGEVLGLGRTINEAAGKVLPLEYQSFLNTESKGTIICVINDRYKDESLPLIEKIVDMNISILGTKDTEQWLRKKGILVQLLMESEEGIIDSLKTDHVLAVVNIPYSPGENRGFEYILRVQATQNKIPLFTSLDTLRFNLHYIESTKQNVDKESTKSLLSYLTGEVFEPKI